MLPNLLVIGATKAGTTTLWAYLDVHPEIYMAPDKELHFFDIDERWARGVEWYEERFAGATDEPVRGEATPGYTRFPHRPEAARRAYDTVPDAKLIYLVRDPIERIRSHYVHEVRQGRERQPFEKATRDNTLYVDASSYAMQLGVWSKYYAPEAIHVVQSEAMFRDQAATMREIYAFVGVDPNVEVDTTRRNETAVALASTPAAQRLRRLPVVGAASRLAPAALRAGVKKGIRRTSIEQRRASQATVTPALRAELAERLRPDVDALRRWMPADFAGWGLA